MRRRKARSVPTNWKMERKRKEEEGQAQKGILERRWGAGEKGGKERRRRERRGGWREEGRGEERGGE